jgi:hypothetical protein
MNLNETPLPELLRDPREAPDFEPALWPTWDGALLVSASDPTSLLKLRLTAAYYLINQEHRALLTVRQEPESPDRDARTRVALQRIERAILAKEQIEAACAPQGLIPDPVVRGGVIADLKLGPKHKPLAQPSTISMHFQVGTPRA